MPFRIIGTLSPKGQSTFGQDQDDLVMIPFTTAERKVLGVAAPSQALTPLNWVVSAAAKSIQFAVPDHGLCQSDLCAGRQARREVKNAIDQLTAILSRRHRILPGQTADFAVRNLSQIAEAAEGSSRIMALLLAAVASISLLVGGIGIMNILLVSVTERTREIGLRMAIGARRLHVLLQFLAEAVFLSVSGGIAGILLGIGFALAIPGRRGLARADFAVGCGRRLSFLRGGWRVFRILPGAESGKPRSHRSAPLRVNNRGPAAHRRNHGQDTPFEVRDARARLPSLPRSRRLRLPPRLKRSIAC